MPNVIEEFRGLTMEQIREVRALLDLAFDDFADHDWDHALGGVHLIATDGGLVTGHAAVVPRCIQFGNLVLTVGYVEAVGVVPRWQGRGIGAALMAAASRVVTRDYAAGVLSTGATSFYEPFGWSVWQGPSYVRLTSGAVQATQGDDGGIMVLRTPALDAVANNAAIICQVRSGDVW